MIKGADLKTIKHLVCKTTVANYLKKIIKKLLWEELNEIPEIKNFFSRIEELENRVAQLQEEIKDLRNNPPVRQKLCDCCDPKQPVVYSSEERTRKYPASKLTGRPPSTLTYTVSFYECKKSGQRYKLNHRFSEG